MSGEHSQIRICPLRILYLKREANIKQIFTRINAKLSLMGVTKELVGGWESV